MKSISRAEAIASIRKQLLTMADKDHSVCEVATRKGIFCRGFQQDSTRDLFKKYAWLVKALKIRSRAELEKYADLWQVARQEVRDMACACDVQTIERDTCLGWDTFPDEKLAEYYAELCGEKIHIDSDSVVEIPPCP